MPFSTTEPTPMSGAKKRRRNLPQGEAGTASLEALLCLPFVFLVFALVLNVGYGWRVRLRADTAVRFTGTSYVHQLSDGQTPAGAASATEEALRRFYYPQGEAFRLSFDPENADLDGAMRDHGGWLPSGPIFGALHTLGLRLSGRHNVQLTVPRRVPTQTLLPDTPVQVVFAIDGNTWTYAEVPLGLQALTDAGTQHSMTAVSFFSWVAEGFLWMLGMES